MQNAAGSGDQDAREWQLDLREIALQIQQEQNQMTSLLQAIHFLGGGFGQAIVGGAGFGIGDDLINHLFR